MQFIPLVEQRPRMQGDADLAEHAPPGGARSGLAPWSVPPRAFGQFLCAVFDE
jgi:sulfatase maturation enzyme AslB (radical SAM superfamily)